MKEQNNLREIQNGGRKRDGIAASRIATSFFVLAILSLGIFSSGAPTTDVHADALPCDPSTATCIDPDCDPTITSCPPVDPPGATKQSAACGPDAASACSPPGNPLGGETDNNRIDDVVNEESEEETASSAYARDKSRFALQIDGTNDIVQYLEDDIVNEVSDTGDRGASDGMDDVTEEEQEEGEEQEENEDSDEE